MSGLEWDTIALLTGTAFLAGFIDSIAGGGGLLTVPAHHRLPIERKAEA